MLQLYIWLRRESILGLLLRKSHMMSVRIWNGGILASRDKVKDRNWQKEAEAYWNGMKNEFFSPCQPALHTMCEPSHITEFQSDYFIINSICVWKLVQGCYNDTFRTWIWKFIPFRIFDIFKTLRCISGSKMTRWCYFLAKYS